MNLPLRSVARLSSQPIAIQTRRKRTRDPLVIGLGAAVVVLATVAGLVAMKSSSRGDAFPYRMEITAPAEQIVGAAALSPDGHALAFVGRDPATQVQVLYLRRLDQLSSRLIAGTTRAQGPVFSPDGKWIAYIAGRRKIMKVSVDGGAPVPLGDVPDYGGVSWSRSGDIVLGAGAGEMLGGLLRVNAAGGRPPLTKVDTADRQLSHQYPVVLADGKTVLFTIWYGNIAKAELAATHLGDGRITKLGVTGTQAIGVVDDQLIFSRADGMLRAIPFDVGRLRATGNEKPVQDSISIQDPSTGTGYASLLSSGALIYARGGNDKQLVWVNQKGEVSRQH